VIARYKHSCLFGLIVSDEGKKFYKIDTRSVSIMAVLPTTFFTGTVDVAFPGTELVISHVCTENWPFSYQLDKFIFTDDEARAFVKDSVTRMDETLSFGCFLLGHFKSLI
jgi:hypothetical protein